MQSQPWSYPILFLAGAMSGLVDSIAGGGGIISLPVLLNVGLPVPVALGTNKLQSSFGSVTAAWHYARAGLLEARACRVGVTATLLGALGGAAAVQQLDARVLESVIPWLLAGIVVYSIVRPQAGLQDHPPRLCPTAFFTLCGLALGFYDGFFGPGTGSFWTIALIAVMGFNFLKATAYTKVMNATSNVAALALFASAGSVDYAAGLVMGAGQLVGARLGARLAMKRGAHFVRPIFLTMVVLVMLRLVYLHLTR
ncbi:MAG TPA: TSUP family transporter [Opitutaceae bacterium]